MVKLISIRSSKNPDKKWTAIFKLDSGKEKKVRFGQKGATDYTVGASLTQRKSYRARHSVDNLHDPMSAGALSYYILWGDSRNMNSNIQTYKRKFNI